MDVNVIIKQILLKSNKNVNYFLQGGCYIFAKALKEVIGGDILYLTEEFHFILSYDNKLYDASGNVTKKYKDSKCIPEYTFLQRKRLVKEFIML